jgi:hypothetical protein
MSQITSRTSERVNNPARDIHWIRGALQSAVAIEHATMPLYAAAMYSIEVQNYPAYNTLRAVLMEEMLHMAAACNALAAIGGAPQIRTLDPTAILQGLPAGVASHLTPRFARLSRRQLDTFMRIEAPLHLVEPANRSGRYPTTASFYEQIKEAILANAGVVEGALRGRHVANQVGGNLGYAVIDPKAGDPVGQVLTSLELIIDQGEGFGQSTLSSGARSQHELSHYARFAELRFGRAYTGPEDSGDGRIASEGQRRYFRGERISWPEVINTLAVPRDGYAAILRLDPNRVEVLRDLRAFDQAYTRMLAALDDSWNGPVEQSWPSLGRAVFEMNELRVISCFNIVHHLVPAGAAAQIDELYPGEAASLRALSDFDAPLFYGPRFANTSLTTRPR